MIVHGSPGMVDVRKLGASGARAGLARALLNDPPLVVVCTSAQASAVADITSTHDTGANGMQAVLVDPLLVKEQVQRIHVRIFTADVNEAVTLDPNLVLDTVNAVDGKPIFRRDHDGRLVLGDDAVSALLLAAEMRP